MKYSRLITAGILLLTFAYVDNLQYVVMEKVECITDHQLAILPEAIGYFMETDTPNCTLPTVKSGCPGLTEEVSFGEKLVGIFKDVKVLQTAC